MTNPRTVVEREIKPRRYRRCAICNVKLEAWAEHDMIATGYSKDFHDRLWLCDDHGKQIRASVRAIGRGFLESTIPLGGIRNANQGPLSRKDDTTRGYT